MIKQKLIFLWIVSSFIYCLSLSAHEKYSLRLSMAQASKNDFGEILSGTTTPTTPKAYTIGVEGGWLWLEDSWNIPLDFYLKGGVNRFLEPDVANHKDFFEFTFYIKAYYKVDFWSNQVRFGIGEGISYALDIPYVEYVEALAEGGENSKYLNYLEVSVDMDIARLLRVGEEVYIGYAIKHRSGIYGLINDVDKGGSNYNMITLETNF
jgi:hypothetical protein